MLRDCGKVKQRKEEADVSVKCHEVTKTFNRTPNRSIVP